MIFPPSPDQVRWQPLGGGSWLFHGTTYRDERGVSDEIFDLTSWPNGLELFESVQENLVTSRYSGCARGLHYQIAPYSQAKLVTVVQGSAQFFWLPLHEKTPEIRVHSIILTAGASSLYTPENCAHGFLAIVDDTRFLLKMSSPVSSTHRGEIGFLSKSLSVSFAIPIREDLLSERDRNAPAWKMRRQTSFP